MEVSKKKVNYKKYILSQDWKKKRQQVFDLRGKECEQCGSEHYIQVHHLNYENLGKEKMEDLQILCYQCHMSKHDEYFEKFILKRKPLAEGFFYPTREDIIKLKTKAGGFNKETVSFLGGRWPPKKGWVRKAQNKQFNIVQFQKAIEKVIEWDSKKEERRAIAESNKENKKPGKRKKEKLTKWEAAHRATMISDLKKKNLESINGKRLVYVKYDMLKKIWTAYQ